MPRSYPRHQSGLELPEHGASARLAPVGGTPLRGRTMEEREKDRAWPRDPPLHASEKIEEADQRVHLSVR